MTKVWCDSSLKESCYIIEGQEPVITKYRHPVTNNAGEYRALLSALFECYLEDIHDVEVYMDSEVVVRQCSLVLNGTPVYKTKEPYLKKLNKAVLTYKTFFDSCVLTHVPREENPAGKILERLR